MRVPALTDIARILAVTTQRVFFSAASLATGEPFNLAVVSRIIFASTSQPTERLAAGVPRGSSRKMWSGKSPAISRFEEAGALPL
jgi:hypothetical protein